jgi:glycine/D-amino acid oxidase-like deaminating enzyme
MPTRRIQRGPATGGAPVGFQNSPAFNELYVDGATDAVVVGTGISGVTAATLAKQGQPTAAAVLFANLPAAPVEGMTYVISDASVNTWGTVIAGGGANRVLAYYNGAAWTVAGK